LQDYAKSKLIDYYGPTFTHKTFGLTILRNITVSAEMRDRRIGCFANVMKLAAKHRQLTSGERVE